LAWAGNQRGNLIEHAFRPKLLRRPPKQNQFDLSGSPPFDA